MINSVKIGKFIVELRGSMSQEKLGNKLGIGRDSISKWERGVALPSHEMLLRLSNEFNVSVNEILYGERKNKDNEEKINEVSVVLYNNVNKNKKKIKYLLLMILFIIAIFGIYYFISSYKSVRIYTIFGESDNIIIDDGIFVKTRGKLYFALNNFIIKNNDKIIKGVSLYYEKIENIIYKDSSLNILINDYYGSSEYFNIKYLKDFDKKLFLAIEYEDGESEIIKLYFTQDYVNDSFIGEKKDVVSSGQKGEIINELIPKDLKPLISAIEEKFDSKDNNIYTFYTKDKNIEYNSVYISDVGTIKLSLYQKGGNNELWQYDMVTKILSYCSSRDERIINDFLYENNSIKCISGNCDNSEDRIDFFWRYLYKLV